MYDFDQIIDRRNTNSMKWDVKENELPMWVADMDFQTAPSVIKALNDKVQKGIFGYTLVPDFWKDAIVSWWDRRHQFKIENDWIIFTTGVVPAITCSVKRLTNVGDNIVVQTPVYDIFFHSIENHGRHVLENELQYDGENYTIDFKDLEAKLADPLTTMMILCNPHNPVGKIWSKEELVQIGELCYKYNVVVVSDEIHCDITEPEQKYTPFATASEICKQNSVTCVSATKAFNIAGLQVAAVIIPSTPLFQKMERGLNSDEIAEPNVFATEAMAAAFNGGEEWLEELRTYIKQNKIIVKEFLEKELPELHLTPSNATYLLWIDCSKLTDNATELGAYIRSKTGLFLSDGTHYRGNGNLFLRMNVACPASRVREGLVRLKDGVRSFQSNK